MTGRLSPASKRRLVLAVALVGTLWAVWRVSVDTVPTQVVGQRPANAVRRAIPKDAAVVPPTAPLEWRRKTSADPVQPPRDLFDQPTVASAASAPASAPLSTVPSLSLKYAGRLVGDAGVQVFLADSKDKLTLAQVGQSVGDGWTLDAIGKDNLTFRHAASGQEHSMPMGAFE